MIVVVIIEGTSEALLRRWIMAGSLRSFFYLMREGTWGGLHSQTVPYEPPALMSAFSGMPPGEHGCFSFWHIHGKRFDEPSEVFLAEDISTPLIWQMSFAEKLRFNIVNVFGTHPPAPLNGNLITYPLYPSLHTCYPPDLLRKLSKDGIHYGHDVSTLYEGIPRDDFITLVKRVEDNRIKACLRLMTQRSDVSIFNITLIDRLSHFWWHEVEPDSYLDDNDTALWFAYQFVDHFIEQVIELMTPNDNLIVFSEIGFGPLKRYISINEILAQLGLLVWKDNQNEIDASHTFALEAVQGTHGINLNLQSRYKDGLISEKNEDMWMQSVREALLSQANQETSLPLFADVLFGRDLYRGKHASKSPDLVIIPQDERYLPLGNPYWAKKVHRHLQTGWHRRNSLWFGFGPRFSKSGVEITGHCIDIAQTIMDCLDLPPLAGLGKSLVPQVSSVLAANPQNSFE